MSTRGDKINGKLKRALEHHRGGQLAEARLAYEKILKAEPRNFHALQLLSTIELQAGRLEAGLALIDRALALRPGDFNALFNRGAALHTLGREKEALESYERAMAVNPSDHRVLHNRDVILQGLGRERESLGDYEKAVNAQPQNPDLLFDAAGVFERASRTNDALALYGAVTRLVPKRAAAHYRCGNILRQLDRLTEALHCFKRAADLEPNYVEALHEYGGILQLQGRVEEALTWHRRALLARKLAPNASKFDDPTSQVLWCQRQLCAWDDCARQTAEALELVAGGKKTLAPFVVLCLTDDPKLQLIDAQDYATQFVPRPAPAAGAPRSGSHEPQLRLGYLSSDFQEHATAELIAGLIESHARTRFKIFGYSYGGPDASPMRQRLTRAFDVFHDVTALTDRECAERIAADGIDILVDLKGYTRGHRFGIVCHRPAPLTVHYLGFPGTMGSPSLDYLIADATVIPPGSEANYSEAIVRLPDVYQANDRNRSIASDLLTRSEFGLPEGQFVYCHFNQAYKIGPVVFESWMRILQAVPGAVLWLLVTDDTARENLKRAAKARGVDPERLVFAQTEPQGRHLARLRLADLFLDSWPVCAHTTAADALWAGLPLLTHPQRSFASRVAASLLRSAGLPELIAPTIEAYEKTAMSLAQDKNKLDALRTRLERDRLTIPLFDTVRFTGNIERAYELMWDNHLRGNPPTAFDVPSLRDPP